MPDVPGRGGGDGSLGDRRLQVRGMPTKQNILGSDDQTASSSFSSDIRALFPLSWLAFS